MTKIIWGVYLVRLVGLAVVTLGSALRSESVEQSLFNLALYMAVLWIFDSSKTIENKE